jgi:ribonucleoside-diphosphate reductase alpha chain
MRIERRYTVAGQDPYSSIPFRQATSEIRNPNGSVVFRQENVEVPAGWSQNAVDVLVQKYFRKAGVPQVTAWFEGTRVPLWLQRSSRRAIRCDSERVRRRDLGEAGVRPPGRLLDLLGLEGRLLHAA